jgi:hypothetical protein
MVVIVPANIEGADRKNLNSLFDELTLRISHVEVGSHSALKIPIFFIADKKHYSSNS